MANFITKFLDNLKLNGRFNLFISVLLIIIFSSLGIYLYQTQKQEVFKISDKQLRVLLEDLINIFEVQTELNQRKVASSMEFAKYLYEKQGEIEKSDSLTIGINAIDQETNEKYRYEVNKWFLNGKCLQENTDFVDFLQKKGIETIAFFQRVEDGFIQISTNLLKSDSTRATGVLLPSSSAVVQAMENEHFFFGRAWLVNQWYLTSFEPIYIDGQLQGFLYVGVKQMDYNLLQPIFYNKSYLQYGYPYVVSGDGFSVINKSGIEGTDLKETKFFELLVTTKDNKKEAFRYFWPEDETGEWKWTYFKYYEPLDVYVATSIFEYELYSGLEKIREGIIYGVIISIIIFFIGMSLIIRPITHSIQKLVEIISAMSLGKAVEKIYYRRKDEIGDIISSLNIYINGINNTSKFANEIERGNFTSEFTPLSKEDLLGNALLDMRKSLRRANKEDLKRKAEDKKQNWSAEGLARFNDILRQRTADIQELSDNIIKNLVHYLKANQAGLFIYNDDDKSREPFLELISTFAYSRKKYYSREILIGEGLVGTCAIEGDTIYLKEIPENYIEIESGLGTANPNILLLVPLTIEDKIFGVIEIASFKEFEDHEVKFVERLAESIASTLSSAKISVKTAELLKESQKQSEELAAKEEEMRSNLEELQATQEESAKRQAEMSGVVAALDSSFLTCELDLQGKIITMNYSFLEVFDLSLRQVTGKRHSELISVEDIDIYTNFWRNISANDSLKIESKHIRDNKEFWLSETFTPICDNMGVPYKVLNIAIDVTKNKKQEFEIQELLRDSRRQAKKLAKQEKLNSFNVEKLARTQAESARKETSMKSILDAIDNSSIRGEYTPEGKLITANDKFLSTFGFHSLDEINDFEIKRLIPKDEQDKFNASWIQVNDGKTYNGVTKRITLNNKEIWLVLSYSPILSKEKDKENEISKILMFANDISELKNAEREALVQIANSLAKYKALNDEVVSYKNQIENCKFYKKESEAIYKAIDTNTQLVIFNSEAIIIDMNNYALKKLDTTRDKLLGKSYSDIANPKNDDEKQSIMDNWDSLRAGEVIKLTKKNIENNKMYYEYEVLTPVIDAEGNLIKVFGLTSYLNCDLDQ